jgi:hypothetical protein
MFRRLIITRIVCVGLLLSLARTANAEENVAAKTNAPKEKQAAPQAAESTNGSPTPSTASPLPNATAPSPASPSAPAQPAPISPDQPPQGEKPANEASITTAAPPPPTEAEKNQCVPNCRSGFVCRQGACVLVCNPPCGPNQYCSAQGECITPYPPNAPPNYTPNNPPDYPPDYPPEFQEHEPPTPSAEPRHTNLFVRFAFGIGYSDLSRDKGDKVEMSGESSSLSLDVGWAVIENLMVHGRVSLEDNNDPVVTYKGRDYVDIRRSELVTWKTLAAATYYLMPINLYGTFALGIAQTFIDIDDYRLRKLTTTGSDVGIALEIDIGKEWWADSEWGIGVAARFGYTNLPPEDTSSLSDRLHLLTGGILLSITYN